MITDLTFGLYLLYCHLVAPVDCLSTIASTIAWNTRVRVKSGNSLWSIVSVQAPLTVHAGCLISTVEANPSSRELARCVEAPHLPLNLRVEVAFVRVAEALTHLTIVAGYKLARPPSLLVEHRATGVAKGSASIVATLALVITGSCYRAVRGMTMAGALASDGDVLDGVEVLPGHAGELWVIAVRQDGLV